jgi:hypothetical protein
MAKNQLSLKAWAWMGASPGLGFIIWLALRFGGVFRPDIRGFVAVCLSAVVTSLAAYFVQSRSHD